MKVKTSLSNKQRRVIKVLKGGGIIYYSRRKTYSYRLLDRFRNPVMNIHGRTFKALKSKELVAKNEDGVWVPALGI